MEELDPITRNYNALRLRGCTIRASGSISAQALAQQLPLRIRAGAIRDLYMSSH